MAVTPGITLTCTLNDLNGQPVKKGTVTILLFGFGANLPMIAGTAMLAKVGPVPYSLADGTFDTGLPLWGNDQITPVNQTYYCITIEDEKKNVVQSGIYQFAGTQTLDLANAPQLSPVVGVPPLQYVTADIWIILSGSLMLTTMDDLIARLTEQQLLNPSRRPKPLPGPSQLSGTFRALSSPPSNTYTLTRTPWGGNLIGLFYNGNLIIPGLHYTLSGRTITLNWTTGVGDNLYASYVAMTLN